MSVFQLNPITGELDLVGSGGPAYITDPAIIANITNEANWSNGEYTGSLAGLAAGNTYLDTVNMIRYEFDGTTLMRNYVNNII